MFAAVTEAEQEREVGIGAGLDCCQPNQLKEVRQIDLATSASAVANHHQTLEVSCVPGQRDKPDV